MSKRSLRDSHGVGQVAALERDHFDRDGFSLLSDGSTVWISEQAAGSPLAQSIEIPKAVFDDLIQRYQTPQQVTAVA